MERNEYSLTRDRAMVRMIESRRNLKRNLNFFSTVISSENQLINNLDEGYLNFQNDKNYDL